MQLDKFTDYALRVLMALTVRAPDRVPASEIAAVYGLSEHHIAKVASGCRNGVDPGACNWPGSRRKLRSGRWFAR